MCCVQSYLRSCGGSNTHPTTRECISRAAGRTMTFVLGAKANNGLLGKEKMYGHFDEQCLELPLKSNRGVKRSATD
eukprot:COSAG01_NODE_28522_length_659_cov_0.867857_1_plen_76_part_00